jgi:hypothetical protein
MSAGRALNSIALDFPIVAGEPQTFSLSLSVSSSAGAGLPPAGPLNVPL